MARRGLEIEQQKIQAKAISNRASTCPEAKLYSLLNGNFHLQKKAPGNLT